MRVSINKLDEYKIGGGEFTSVKIQGHEITAEYVDDIMITALEGGITYWCGKAIVKKKPISDYEYASDVISRGGILTLVDIEDSSERWDLDINKFLKGVELNLNFLKEKGKQFSTEDFDSDDADRIIQYALFDEITFG